MKKIFSKCDDEIISLLSCSGEDKYKGDTVYLSQIRKTSNIVAHISKISKENPIRILSTYSSNTLVSYGYEADLLLRLTKDMRYTAVVGSLKEKKGNPLLIKMQKAN